MITTTIQDQFIAQVANEELSIEELKDVNGSLGILAPVVGAFAAGYAVGTVLGKATGLIDWIYWFSSIQQKHIMTKQNQLSLEELQAICGGFKEGGCIVIRPCFPIPNFPMPTDYPNPQKSIGRIWVRVLNQQMNIIQSKPR